GGAWNGAGIVSAAAGAAPNRYLVAASEATDALGIAGSESGVFAGEVTDSTAVLLRFTVGGDTNLNGRISAGDYKGIDRSFFIAGSTGYANGDFDFNGTIGADDFWVIDQNYYVALPK